MLTPLPFEPGVAGVDEAGRGPIAGPLVVAAVMLPSRFDTFGLDDSKRLTRGERELQFDRIVAGAEYAIITVPTEEVDRVNILRATLNAMSQALRDLPGHAYRAVIDGNQYPIDPPCPCDLIVKGDSHRAEIAAASILAKVTRDRLMVAAAETYPGYGFDTHFGYHRPDHIEALERLGPCPLHRRSFEPIKTMVNQPCLIFGD